MNALRQCVGQVDEAEHEGKLERGVEVQVDVLQDQRTHETDDSADSFKDQKHKCLIRMEEWKLIKLLCLQT